MNKRINIEKEQEETDLYPIDWMDVFHAVEYDSADFFERFVWTHNADCVALD